jgi:hypothetical protein
MRVALCEKFARGPRPRVALGALGTAAVLALVGCTGPAMHPGGDPDGHPRVAVSASVHQTRSNVAARQLSLAITNTGGAPIEVTAARFVSDQFASAAVWQKDRTNIRPGVTADLPVSLPAANCSATDIRPVVIVTYRIVPAPGDPGDGGAPAGEQRTVSLEPEDSLGQLEPLFTADCLYAAATRIATITASTAPRVIDIGGRPVAELDLAITPAGGRGSLTVLTVNGTTLFTQFAPALNASVDARVVDVAVVGNASPSVLTLSLVPSRCDPHAVAEDKLGTVFPVKVKIAAEAHDVRTGVLSVAASDEVRAALYDFVDRSCGW